MQYLILNCCKVFWSLGTYPLLFTDVAAIAASGAACMAAPAAGHGHLSATVADSQVTARTADIGTSIETAAAAFSEDTRLEALPERQGASSGSPRNDSSPTASQRPPCMISRTACLTRRACSLHCATAGFETSSRPACKVYTDCRGSD
eukprot:6213059-Pleurochrysis_carterae.AAC.9